MSKRKEPALSRRHRTIFGVKVLKLGPFVQKNLFFLGSNRLSLHKWIQLQQFNQLSYLLIYVETAFCTIFKRDFLLIGFQKVCKLINIIQRYPIGYTELEYSFYPLRFNFSTHNDSRVYF